MGWSALVVLTGPLACTYLNPDFNDATTANEGSGPSSNSGDDQPRPTTSPRPSADTGSKTSEGTTTMPATTMTPAATTMDTDDGSSSSTDGSEACIPAFGLPMQIDLEPSIDPTTCSGTRYRTFRILQQMSEFEYEVRDCFVCPCDFGMIHMVRFDHPPPMLQLNACYEFEVQFDGEGDMGCFVQAYTISNINDLLQVVSNVGEPDVAGGFAFELADDPMEECGGGCPTDDVGYYPLRALDNKGPEIPPEVTVMYPNGFLVRNESSGIPQSCEPIIRWHATRMPN